MRTSSQLIEQPARGSPAIAVPAARRLHALSALDRLAVEALRAAAREPRTFRVQSEIVREGEPIEQATLFLDGWAARVRQMADGRRAILDFLLPGDLCGLCDHEQPRSAASVVALTTVTVCAAPARAASPALARAYSVARGVAETHLLGQIARLSRLNAYDRFADLMLELMERLELAGLSVGGNFDLPLTQEVVSDALGLSIVHLNRTVQQARKTQILSWSGHKVRIIDPAALRQAIGRRPVALGAAVLRPHCASTDALPAG
jgi:CRP-like cAMP-binding protein